jgi:hypothetical protein
MDIARSLPLKCIVFSVNSQKALSAWHRGYPKTKGWPLADVSQWWRDLHGKEDVKRGFSDFRSEKWKRMSEIEGEPGRFKDDLPLAMGLESIMRAVSISPRNVGDSPIQDYMRITLPCEYPSRHSIVINGPLIICHQCTRSRNCV